MPHNAFPPRRLNGPTDATSFGWSLNRSSFAVHQWLDNWEGVGLIATGMERQGYRLSLTNVEPGIWRATFSSHPLTSAEGFGTARRRGARSQEAAWTVLKDFDSDCAA